MKTMFFLTALVASAAADELHLKDGSTIEWVTLKDLGNTYEVVTVQGGKAVIEKSDVSKIVPKRPKAPLDGATFTFDKKQKVETLDLLKLVDQKNASAGMWESDGRLLVTPAAPHARLAFPTAISDEYDLQVILQKESGNGAFYTFLPIPEGRIMVTIDGKDGVQGGVEGVASTMYRNKMFSDTKPHNVVFHVRKTRFVVMFDKKKLVDWLDPDYTSTKVPEKVDVPHKGIVIGDYDTSYTISKLTLTQSY